MVDVIVRQFPLIVSAFCAVILVVLVVALIFRPQFRQDLLSAESEASLLRIVSIKGVALLTFISLFVFGTIYPVWVYSEHCKDAPHERRGVSSGIRLIEDYIQSRVPVAIRPYVEPVAEDLQDSLGRLDEGTVMIYGKYAGSTPAKDKLVEMPPGSTVLATHVPAKARGLEDMYAWDKPPLSSFFRLNVQMIKRTLLTPMLAALRTDVQFKSCKNMNKMVLKSL